MFDSHLHKSIISIILGFGLATLFRRTCLNKNCIVINGPSVYEIENKIHKMNGKCFKYKSKKVNCN